ncbi:MAG: bifunctional adenosylcobinamide kinase/adenosylcobinamide-phosphate guanylyltransferase [Candidatus Scalindua sp. AMX11]|nr:MAG: bifunctional adenosylcobinamide kinase/adenosylcobinamide-phosphate guanylyltransferase [Candidatus Scalindua sp.]NOG85123.1 bifunctional adenosylcobinamide kinase/adenosylcobinamide-phosphate guanylyltransferase [Planctomycetota bacterium]RZV69295.1 MAG: bifunctional adenosylcobinamide kinase/adenosylcobinamide-phosphate guanylyltransferase [Candidatus Scalindua sp. SCAELEC01]TDE66794.1 MAG: bifunctional adenosylcobinamide kinase/adenosylcobinamide-phosphate guanylyltransferase [Candida
MAQLTFIIGGTRSGKSAFALQLAHKQQNVCYIATASPAQSAEFNDDEMLQRIKKHQADRPAHWRTVEAPLDLDKAISQLNGDFDVVLVDCITIYVTNMLLKDSKKEEPEKDILEAINRLCIVCKEIASHVIIVTNEVGYGIVPDSRLARRFRDIAGHVNQLIAKEADTVFLVTAGIETKIK